MLFLLLFFIHPSAGAEDIMKDFDSLGGNDVLIDRARLLHPDKQIEIVQKRVVNRNGRSEFSLGYINVIGGDAYLQTQMLSLNYHFHINPRWAVGLGYFSAYNSLSREGRFLIARDGLVPDVDQPDSGYELMVNFAPIYGKINLLDMGVLQFDMYAIGSYGGIRLKSGDTNTFGLGVGLGLWISQHLTSRLEIRQRFYRAQRFDGNVQIRTTLAGVSFGYMF